MSAVDEIRNFIKHAEDVIENFDTALGWNDNNERKNTQDLIQCPVNKNHLISQLSLEKHARKCKWRNMGYSKEDVDEIIFQEDSCIPNKTISIDEFIATLVPHAPTLRTDQAFHTYLNNEQRLKVYDFIRNKLQNTKDFDPALYNNLHQAITNPKDNKQKSDAGIAEEMRDFKRRRQSYRAKNVHITKRSHTEIIREVLNIHMDELTELWAHTNSSPKNPAKIPNESSRESRTPVKGERSSRDTPAGSRDLAKFSRDVGALASPPSRIVSDRNSSICASPSRRDRHASRDISRDCESRDREKSPKKKKRKKEKRDAEKQNKKSHKNKRKKHERRI